MKVRMNCEKTSCNMGDVLNYQDFGDGEYQVLLRITNLDILAKYADGVISENGINTESGGLILWLNYIRHDFAEEAMKLGEWRDLSGCSFEVIS